MLRDKLRGITIAACRKQSEDWIADNWDDIVEFCMNAAAKGGYQIELRCIEYPELFGGTPYVLAVLDALKEKCASEKLSFEYNDRASAYEISWQ